MQKRCQLCTIAHGHTKKLTTKQDAWGKTVSETHRTQALDPYLQLSQQFVTIASETTWLQNLILKMNPVMDLMKHHSLGEIRGWVPFFGKKVLQMLRIVGRRFPSF